MAKQWFFGSVLLAAVLFMAMTSNLGQAQPSVNSQYDYRVVTANELLEATHGKMDVDHQTTKMTPALIAGALNQLATDDWELVAVTPADQWVFRRLIVN